MRHFVRGLRLAALTSGLVFLLFGFTATSQAVTYGSGTSFCQCDGGYSDSGVSQADCTDANLNKTNCHFFSKQQGCCCIKGEDCVVKDYYNINSDCSAVDFPNHQTYKPQFYFKPVQSNGTCAIEPLNYCTCQDSSTKQCDNTVSYNDKKHRLSCGGKDDPYSCTTYCAQTKTKSALFCDTDPAIADGHRTQSIKTANGGCAPTHCWCKNTAGYCTHDTTDKKGNFFAADDACKTFCNEKNVGTEKGWAELKPLENTYTNYFADSGDKGCKFSLPPVDVSPYDFTANIRSAAAGLNKLDPSISSPAQFIGNGIKVMLLFIGSIALIMYIYGGLLWMTAAGNTERISKSKQILVYATLGVIAMLGSYLLVQFVFGTVLKLNVQ